MISFALVLGLQPSDLKLLTAAFVVLFLAMPLLVGWRKILADR